MLNNEPVTFDNLRKNFCKNDFSTMPIKDSSVYNEKELKLYNRVLRIINKEWRSVWQ